jgi:hypothetical protein
MTTGSLECRVQVGMVLQYHLWCRICDSAGWHSVMIAAKFVAQIGLVLWDKPPIEFARLGELYCVEPARPLPGFKFARLQ